MHRTDRPFVRSVPLAAALAAACAVSQASAADLAVAGIEVTQGFQNGGISLVGGRATMIRVRIAVTGSGVAIPGVDAVLRMVVNGEESPAGPFFSQNGPITAPLVPNTSSIDQTLNFIVVPPVSANVVFKVLVNPTGSVVESSTANNLYQSAAYTFGCRAVVDLAYVPINYTFGAGMPSADMMRPGRADNFLRGIYAMGEWNYHRTPLGAITWEENVDGTSSDLLDALQDIRNSLIPGAGYAKPEFIYGFLPGNPFSGNGLANAVPGTVAFGNTEQVRWQRTFAHEIGHLWGRPHTGDQLNAPSIDVEHHLFDPLGLPVLHASNQSDVMVPGLVTNQAWVSQATYNDALSDERSQCGSFADGGDAGGAESDFAFPARRWAPADEERCLRVAGVITHDGRRVVLRPVTRMDLASPTIDDPRGDLSIEALDGAGRVLHRVRVRTDTLLESCAGGGARNPTAPVYALLPESAGLAACERIEVRDLRGPVAPAARGAAAPGALRGDAPVAAAIVRSPSAPSARIVSAGWAAAVAPLGSAAAAKSVEVVVDLSDPDGDSVAAMLLYSPDGGRRWAPVTVDAKSGPIVFDPANLPGALPGLGLLRLRASDGLNIVEHDAPIEAMFMEGNPPDIHVISPNADAYRQGATLVLHASGWDMEDEYLPDEAFTWTSSLDGPVGNGRLLTTRSLSPGVHVLTLSGVDSDGQSGQDSVTLTINPRSLPDADFNNDGLVNGDDLGTLLGNWGAFGVGDLNFDGVVDGDDLGTLLGAWTT